MYVAFLRRRLRMCGWGPLEDCWFLLSLRDLPGLNLRVPRG
jgi:hypothetical protein